MIEDAHSSQNGPSVTGKGDHAPIQPSTPLGRRRLYLYLLPVIAFPFLLLISAFVIVPTRWFDLHSGNTYLPNLGYGASLVHRECQVLIYGDSSALVGLDPAIIQQQTGLTACNIAEFEGITLSTHTLLIDMFLQHNPSPRFVIFLYTPEDLSITSDWESFHVGTFEAVTFMLEHARNLNTAWLLASHPATTFGWAEQGLRLALEHFHSKPMLYAPAHVRESTNGQLPVATDSIARCDGNLHDRLPDPAWISQLRQRYSTNGTHVIVDATPTVACDASLEFFQHHLNGLIDNSPYQPLPISSFSSDGRLHANRQGSRLLSIMVANQIVSQLNHAPTAATARNTGER